MGGGGASFVALEAKTGGDFSLFEVFIFFQERAIGESAEAGSAHADTNI